MKFLFSSADKWNSQGANLVRLNLLGQIGNLAEDDSSSPLLQGSTDDAEGLFSGDTQENFLGRRGNITKQASEAAVRESVGGSYWSGMLNPDRFKGYVGLQAKLMDPVFWAGTFFAGKEVVLSQLKAGMKEVGSPSKLMGKTPQLRGKHFKALVSEEAVSSILNNLHIGRPFMGRTSAISLSSLDFVEEVLQSRLQQVNAIQEEQFADFTAKIQTEVWWKRLARKPLAQDWFYKKKFERIKYLNRIAHEELISEIKSLKQQKEQQVFAARQTLDARIQEAENEGNTENLNRIRQTIHAVLNQPEIFIQNKGVLVGYDTEAVFGKRFSPIDVLEALRDVKYEQLKFDGVLVENFVDSAVAVNQVKVSHYNSLRVIKGLQNRMDSLRQFDATSIEALEKVIQEVYEPGSVREDLKNPVSLVEEITNALGSSTPQLLRKMNDVVESGGDVYLASTEIFWHFVQYFGKNPAAFKALPAKLQQRFSAFFIQKRSQLEESLISGSSNEKGTFLWRMKTLQLAKIVTDSAEDVVEILPKLGEDLRTSRAQESLLVLKTFVDNYNSFHSFIGGGDIDSLLSQLPEYERGILHNVQELGDFVEVIKKSHESLHEERNKFEQLLDFDEQDIERIENQYQRAQERYDEINRSRYSGLGGAAGTILEGLGSGSDPEGVLAGSDLETAATTAQREIRELRELLYGKNNQEGAANQDGGLKGKQRKIKEFTFDSLPGNIGPMIHRISGFTGTLLSARAKELGIDDLNDLSILDQEGSKLSFDILARLDLGQRVTEDVLATANTLLQNDAVQQFKRLKEAKYIALDQLMYAESSYQKNLTTAHLQEPSKLENLLFARTDSDGSLWYHNQNQVVRITAPRLKNEEDQRNIAIWNKAPEERGLGPFTISHTQPDALGIYLTANPENAAAVDNELYGKKLETKVLGIQGEIQRVLNRAA